MIRLSNHSRKHLLEAVSAAISRFQAAAHAVDEAAAELLRLNRTDLGVVSMLVDSAPQSASALAAAAGLSRAAMTTVLDRLERAGYGRRMADPNDRRRVMVELTEDARALTDRIWPPLAAEGLRSLELFADDELDVIRRFLGDAESQRKAHASHIRSLARRAEARSH